MNPTFEQLEEAFPGKAQEILDLIEKRTLATSYVSALQHLNNKPYAPWHRCLMFAIDEVIGHTDYKACSACVSWGKGYLLYWDFIKECVVLEKVEWIE